MEVNITGYPEQMRFIQSEALELAFIAGLGSGKTHAGTEKMLDRLLKNPGAAAIVTAPSYRVMEMATMPKYDLIFPPELVKRKKTRPHPQWTLRNGCVIYFFSTDNPESIVGGEIAFAHMDEASLSPHLSYVNVKKRMRQTDINGVPYPYQLWITTTPKQLNWVYNEFGPDAPEARELFQASTTDNIYRTPQEIAAYIDKLGLSEREYEQEIEGKFVLLAGDGLFKPEDLDKQLKNCGEYEDVRDNGQVIIYRSPIIGVRYVAGADCADAGGEGVNNMVVLDPQTGSEVAEVYADTPPDKFAQLCYNLGIEYNNALFAPERNGTVGGRVIQKLIDMEYPNLYMDERGKHGWYTHSTATPPKVDRLTMLKEYEEAVRTRQTVIRSSDAIGEMSTFVRDKSGKYIHIENRRDDRIFARAIAWQMRKYVRTGKKGFQSFRRRQSSYSVRNNAPTRAMIWS